MYQKYGDNVKCLRFISKFLKRLMAKLITFETIPSEIGAVNTFFFTSRNNCNKSKTTNFHQHI